MVLAADGVTNLGNSQTPGGGVNIDGTLYINGVPVALTGLVPEAPVNSLTYSRQNAAWVPDRIIRNQADFDALIPGGLVPDGITIFAPPTSKVFIVSGPLVIQTGTSPSLLTVDFASTIISCDSIQMQESVAFKTVGIFFSCNIQIFDASPLTVGPIIIMEDGGFAASVGGTIDNCTRYDVTRVFGTNLVTSPIFFSGSPQIIIHKDTQMGTAGFFGLIGSLYSIVGVDSPATAIIAFENVLIQDPNANQSVMKTSGDTDFISLTVDGGGFINADDTNEYISNVTVQSVNATFRGALSEVEVTEVQGGLFVNNNIDVTINPGVLIWTPIVADEMLLTSNTVRFIQRNSTEMWYIGKETERGKSSITVIPIRASGTGQLDYSLGIFYNGKIILPAPFNVVGDTTSASDVVINTDTSNMVEGMAVFGDSFTDNSAQVLSIDSPTQFTATVDAIATIGADPLTVGLENSLPMGIENDFTNFSMAPPVILNPSSDLPGTTVIATPTVTGTDTSNIQEGQGIESSSFPLGTKILSIDSGTQFTADQNATLSGAVSLEICDTLGAYVRSDASNTIDTVFPFMQWNTE